MAFEFPDQQGANASVRRPERLVLLFGLATGVVGILLATMHFASSPELDYHAYYFAGRAVIQGEPFVGWAITDGSFLTEKAYVYTPITAPVFAVYGIFPRWQIGYVLNIAVLFVVFFQIGRLLIDFVERYGGQLDRVDRLLILGFCLFSGQSILAVYRGNVDPIILLGLAVGLVAIENGAQWKGGTLWATAAHFKLFPAFLGVWMLYRRAYRAIAAAIVTGLGLLALGVLVFGINAHVEWFNFILHERSRQGSFAGGLDPTRRWITLRRPLSQFLPLTGNQLIVLSTAIIAPVVYLVYRDAESDLDAIVAFFATMVAMLITVVPSTAGYVICLYFPLIALVYLTGEPITKYLFLAGLVLVNVPMYPGHVQMVVDVLPLSPAIGDAIVGGARTVMTYSSIPLLGFVLVLAGCLRFVRVPDPLAAPASED